MCVIVNETGRDETAVRIDHTRAARSKRVDLSIRSNGNQSFATNRERFGARLQSVARPDERVVHDEIGVAVPARRRLIRGLAGDHEYRSNATAANPPDDLMHSVACHWLKLPRLSEHRTPDWGVPLSRWNVGHLLVKTKG
jgi:hypothetical protein